MEWKNDPKGACLYRTVGTDQKSAGLPNIHKHLLLPKYDINVSAYILIYTSYHA